MIILPLELVPLVMAYVVALVFAVGIEFVAEKWMKRYPATQCAQCGYDMRSLPDKARCPECGRVHERSLATEITSSQSYATLDPRTYMLPAAVCFALLILKTIVLPLLR
ncbi:MAG: hypothetical protein H6815_00660 [Phycisphaeraceae bacterium]|nr:hypothetical protein [Phycisphaerales bacterium]MCB9858935.1 hypothetical protein [Phycisphaeraceae bacterium]